MLTQLLADKNQAEVSSIINQAIAELPQK